jgi:uncharacterized protein YndB with AHSA1/START domain
MRLPSVPSRMRQEDSVIIARPVPEVFAYLADFGNTPAWAEGVTRMEVAGGVTAVGATFRLAIQEGARERWYEGEVLAREEGRRVVSRMTREGMVIRTELMVEPVGGGTRVTQVADTRLSGFMVLLKPLVWVFTRNLLRKQNANIQAILEESGERVTA